MIKELHNKKITDEKSIVTLMLYIFSILSLLNVKDK